MFAGQITINKLVRPNTRPRWAKYSLAKMPNTAMASGALYLMGIIDDVQPRN
jgi:hypothetical protein